VPAESSRATNQMTQRMVIQPRPPPCAELPRSLRLKAPQRPFLPAVRAPRSWVTLPLPAPRRHAQRDLAAVGVTPNAKLDAACPQAPPGPGPDAAAASRCPRNRADGLDQHLLDPRPAAHLRTPGPPGRRHQGSGAIGCGCPGASPWPPVRQPPCPGPAPGIFTSPPPPVRDSTTRKRRKLTEGDLQVLRPVPRRAAKKRPSSAEPNPDLRYDSADRYPSLRDCHAPVPPSLPVSGPAPAPGLILACGHR